jgi:hypothetical protein
MCTCTICQKPINRGGICNNCWKEWTFTGTYSVNSISWLSDLIKMQRRFERQRTELAFSVVGIDTDYLYERELEPETEEIDCE